MTSIMFYIMEMICMTASLWCMFADNYQMATYSFYLNTEEIKRGKKNESKHKGL